MILKHISCIKYISTKTTLLSCVSSHFVSAYALYFWSKSQNLGKKKNQVCNLTKNGWKVKTTRVKQETESKARGKKEVGYFRERDAGGIKGEAGWCRRGNNREAVKKIKREQQRDAEQRDADEKPRTKEERESNRRRGWRLRGRQTYHNQAETSRQLWEQNLILRHRHTKMYMHMHKHRLTGAHTQAHTIQKSHITHEILMVQSNQQKWRWGETQKREGDRRRGVRKGYRWKQYVFITNAGMWTITKMTCISNHHFYHEHDQPKETTYFLPQWCCIYVFHGATKQGHPECSNALMQSHSGNNKYIRNTHVHMLICT